MVFWVPLFLVGCEPLESWGYVLSILVFYSYSLKESLGKLEISTGTYPDDDTVP